MDVVGLKPVLRTTTSFSALTLLVGSFDPQKPSPKWPIMCLVGRWTLLTSLHYSPRRWKTTKEQINKDGEKFSLYLTEMQNTSQHLSIKQTLTIVCYFGKWIGLSDLSWSRNRWSNKNVLREIFRFWHVVAKNKHKLFRIDCLTNNIIGKFWIFTWLPIYIYIINTQKWTNVKIDILYSPYNGSKRKIT